MKWLLNEVVVRMMHVLDEERALSEWGIIQKAGSNYNYVSRKIRQLEKYNIVKIDQARDKKSKYAITLTKKGKVVKDNLDDICCLSVRNWSDNGK